jgi:ABC-type lipoprotein release transport system permease subunit
MSEPTEQIAGRGIPLAILIPELLAGALLLVAVIAGMLGAELPARRASCLDILDALQYE